MTNSKLSPHLSPRRKIARAALALALLSGTALAGYGAGHGVFAGEAIAPAAPTARVPDFAAVVARVKPAVVSITTHLQVSEAAQEGPVPFPFAVPNQGEPDAAGPRMTEARGSGFIIDANGTIVTNNHVVKNAKSVTVTLSDGTELKARVLGRDPRTDLAVLKIDPPHSLSYVALGDSDKAQPGQWVIAMGNPFGLGGSVTAGIVSARGRDIGNGPYDNFIQVDAPINQGNSGGPLFTQDGEVIGINTAILSPSGGSVGIGFAIPSNMVKTVVAELETDGHVTRGWLGVEAQPVDKALAAALGLPAKTAAEGALVASVTPDSPAARAGLEPGDLIVGVDDKHVANPRDLALDIAAMKPGSSASLAILRSGETRTLTATLAMQPGEQVADRAGAAKPSDTPRLGLALQPLTPELRGQIELPRGTDGVMVAGVERGSPAEAAGIQPGDVILGVGAHAVKTPQEAIAAIRTEAHARHAVALRILRDGQVGYAAVELRPADKSEDQG